MIACLDVRANDKGDLVVTKGDQYDVREHSDEHQVWKFTWFCFTCSTARFVMCEGTGILLHISFISAILL